MQVHITRRQVGISMCQVPPVRIGCERTRRQRLVDDLLLVAIPQVFVCTPFFIEDPPENVEDGREPTTVFGRTVRCGGKCVNRVVLNQPRVNVFGAIEHRQRVVLPIVAEEPLPFEDVARRFKQAAPPSSGCSRASDWSTPRARPSSAFASSS